MRRRVLRVEAMPGKDVFGSQEQSIGWKTVALREGRVQRFSQSDDLVNQRDI